MNVCNKPLQGHQLEASSHFETKILDHFLAACFRREPEARQINQPTCRYNGGLQLRNTSPKSSLSGLPQSPAEITQTRGATDRNLNWAVGAPASSHLEDIKIHHPLWRRQLLMNLCRGFVMTWWRALLAAVRLLRLFLLLSRHRQYLHSTCRFAIIVNLKQSWHYRNTNVA